MANPTSPSSLIDTTRCGVSDRLSFFGSNQKRTCTDYS